MKMSKKALSLLAVAALLISLLSVVPFVTAGAANSNPVVNGDFADGFTGWTSSAMSYDETAGVYYYPAVGTSSQRYILENGKLSSDKSTGAFMMQKVSVTAGKTYLLTAKVAGGATGAGVAVADCTGDDKSAWDSALANSTLKFQDSSIYSSTQIATIAFKATTDAVVIGFNNTSGAWANVDDIAIVEIPSAVVNGDFANGFDGWMTSYAYDAASGRYTSGNAYYQIESGKLSAGAYTGSPMLRPVAVTSGKTYVLTAKLTGGVTGAGVYIADAAGNELGLWETNLKNSNYKFLDSNAYGVTQDVEIEFTPATNVVLIGFNNPSGTWANVDDFALTEKAAPPVDVLLSGSVTKVAATTNAITVTWPIAGGVAPAADITYSVYASKNAITLNNIGSLTPVTTVAGDAAKLEATVTGLESGTPYYFAVKAADTTPDNEAAETVTIFSTAIRTLSTAPTELLINGGFENVQVATNVNDIAGAGFGVGTEVEGLWNMVSARSTDMLVDDFGAACRKITTADKHGGNYALSFRFNATGFHAARQIFNVTKGNKYTLTFWYKGMAGARAALAPDWAQWITGAYSASATMEETDEWTKYTVEYYASNDGEMSLWLTGAEKSDGTECIFDDVSVVEEYAPLYFSGNSTAVNSITKDSVNISWSAPTVQSGEAAVTGYKVYISKTVITPDNIASLTPVASVTSTEYTYTGLEANTRYYFAVEATNGTNSTYLIDAQATYTQKDQAAPAAGTNLIIDGGFDVIEEFSDNPRDGWHLVGGTGEIWLRWGNVYTDVGSEEKMGSVIMYPWQAMMVQYVQVKPNTTYAYSFNVACSQLDGGPAFRVYERADGKWNGKVLHEHKVTTDSTIGTSYQGTFTTGPDTTEVYINPHNQYVTTGSGGECFFDEIYLVEVEDTSLYMLGSMTLVERGEDYIIISWPQAQADEDASKLTYKVYASDKPITAANIGSLTPIATVAGDDEYREAEQGDLHAGEKCYFAVAVTNSQGKTAYLFSDTPFVTEGEEEEDEDDGDYTGNGGGNAGIGGGNDGTGSGNDGTGSGNDGESVAPDTGESLAMLMAAVLVALLAAVALFVTKRRAQN